MNNLLEFIRGAVRPYLAYSGWTAIIILTVILALRFADKEMTLLFVGALIGTVSTVVGFYVRDRVSK